MNIMKALVQREIIDGKNGYLRVPVILAGIAVVFVFLTALGVGRMEMFVGMEHRGVENVADFIQLLEEKEGENKSAVIAMGYWAMSSLPLIAFPFVVFFSLLGSLYEERRDRSILFWKSMPVADWQEVAVKLFVPVFVAPIVFLAVIIAAQLIIALFMSFIVMFQGGSFTAMWPLSFMLGGWFAGITMYLIHAFWLVPVLAWVLLVSSYANRMPFLWAILVPVVVAVMEEVFFDTHFIAEWIAIHMGAWLEGPFGGSVNHFTDANEALRYLIGGPQWEALIYSLSSLHFWAGLLVAGGLVFATIEKRKRAI